MGPVLNESKSNERDDQMSPNEEGRMSPTRFKLLNLRTLINITGYNLGCNDEHPFSRDASSLGLVPGKSLSIQLSFLMLFANFPSANFVYRPHQICPTLTVVARAIHGPRPSSHSLFIAPQLRYGRPVGPQGVDVRGKEETKEATRNMWRLAHLSPLRIPLHQAL
jgi:hypothetical protein